MSLKFLQVVIVGEDLPEAKLLRAFDRAAEWRRTSQTTWLVYSKFDAVKWVKRLRDVLDQTGSIYVIEFDPDKVEGFMEDGFWTFLGYEEDELETEDAD